MTAYHALKLILRRLAKTPGFTAITLITLAIGIGASTAIFSVVDGVLLKPLPYRQPDRLVGLWVAAPGWGFRNVNMSPASYFVYREQNRVFEDVGIFRGGTVSVTGVAGPEQANTIAVTDGVFPILGVRPVVGRWFEHADDLPHNPKTAILSYTYWRRRFGANPNVIGSTVTMDGQPRQIIGVMPKGFRLLDYQEPALFLPFQLNRSEAQLSDYSYDGVARLKTGITLAAANADVDRMEAIVLRSFAPPPGFSLHLFEQARMTGNLHPLKQDVVGDISKLLWILMGSVSTVLLIACANVANLLLVRSEGRQQELAIRAALGATRIRIAADILFESVLFGLIGCVLGLLIAYGGLRLLVGLAPHGLPRLGEIGINPVVLVFAIFVSLLASILSGLVPVVKYASIRGSDRLREGGRTISQGQERHRVRNLLVIIQVALAFVLLICSGLMIRTFHSITQVNPGFRDPSSVQTFRLSIPDNEVDNGESVVRMEQAIREKIAAIPGVSSVAMTNAAPMSGYQSKNPIVAEDKNYPEGKLPPVRSLKYVSPGLFQTLGINLITGRDFTWPDTYETVPIAIVSQNFAREYWGTAMNALGKHIRVGAKDDWREIVGVVDDVHDTGTYVDAPTTVYCPLYLKNFEGIGGRAIRGLHFVIRTPRAGTENFMAEVRNAVWSVDRNLPLAEEYTLDYFYNRSMARTSFTLLMLGIAGAAGLLLGIIGLHSVIAYSVAQRRKEIGIRMALGAQREALVNMFVRQGLVLTGVGVVCGFAAAIGLTRLMASLLFHVSTLDPITYFSVTAVLLGTATLASYAPSRRAATVDPMETLRSE